MSTAARRWRSASLGAEAGRLGVPADSQAPAEACELCEHVEVAAQQPEGSPVSRAALTLQVRVKPNARAHALERASDGTWLARLKAPPIDGKANAELIALVAEHFRLRQAQVSIRSGTTGRLKRVRIEQPPAELAALGDVAPG